MTTIIEFLEARLTDDEFAAMHSGKLPVPEANYHLRTLREVAAKRSILRRYQDAPIADAAVLLPVLRDLASVYTQHPEYDPEWQPMKGTTDVDLRRTTAARAQELRGYS